VCVCERKRMGENEREEVLDASDDRLLCRLPYECVCVCVRV